MADEPDIRHQVAAVARRHGVAAEDIEEVAGGVANRAFALGERLFLRISRPGYEPDLAKEVSLVPAARSVGVRTPAIVDYDPTHTLIDAPYAVMERVHGTEPTHLPTELAVNLARLHRLDRADLPQDDWGDPWRTIDDLTSRGYLDPGTSRWLTGWFQRLADHIDQSRPTVLIHGDVAGHNLLVDSHGDLAALIDWGDAARAPRAMDFAKLPLTQAALLLPDYLHHTDSPESEPELAAGILWFHLSWALAKLPAPPWPAQRHWTAPTASRLLNILHFFTTTPPTPWSTLT